MKKLKLLSKVIKHLGAFWFPWLMLFAMLGVALLSTPSFSWAWDVALFSLMGVFIMVLILKPMNIIYGLIGTRGDISYYFVMFLVINCMFASIYYNAFFKNGGITYDTSQPHVEFNLFEGKKDVQVLTLHVNDDRAHTPITNGLDSMHYYHIGFPWVMQNTFLTALMQEPTDFFSVSTTFTGVNPDEDRNYRMSIVFHWFLIFHILISWILLGVFISMVYQKFRKS